MHETNVAIIGGGLSGLHTARLLAGHGIDFLLIEAKERLGGRILGASVPWADASRAQYDLGPTWFWPAFRSEQT